MAGIGDARAGVLSQALGQQYDAPVQALVTQLYGLGLIGQSHRDFLSSSGQGCSVGSGRLVCNGMPLWVD